MSPRLRRDPRAPRELRRDRDGNLFDIDEHRPVALAELADDVRAGRHFRVRNQDTDADCTQQVLLAVLRGSMLPTPRLGELAAARLPGLGDALGAAFARAVTTEQDATPARRRRRGRDENASGLLVGHGPEEATE